MTHVLNSVSGRLFTFVSLVLFSGVFSCFVNGNKFLCFLFCLTFSVSMKLDVMKELPVVVLKVRPCVGVSLCVCPEALVEELDLT